jgi:RimJ/RimL family protein N-acetyltransferase
MTLIIRAVTLSDAQGYNLALDAVAREGRYLRLRQAPPVGASESFIAGNIERGNPHFVALIDGEVVGWCDICRDEGEGSRHVGGLGMGLVSAHRSKGIGRMLIEAALDQAKDRFRRVELDVYASNTPAIRLYEKSGFAHEGRRVGGIEIDGRDEDVLMMARLFR